MSDLTIFGKTFSDVKGIKATDTDGNEVVYGAGVSIDDVASGWDWLDGDITLDCTSIKQYAFYTANPTNPFSIYAPKVTYLGGQAFQQAQNMLEAHFPALTSFQSVGYQLFAPSSGSKRILRLVDWGYCNIPANWARYNVNLKTIILRKTGSVATLGNISAVQNTPFYTNGTGGEVYVPQALIEDYKVATTWATL